ncbi:MAG: hypothetical protein IPJ71_07175 [Bdellovibrionales bacterium]|nr:hypothetical protein [Bdellovibrionales bacterium]
MFKCLKLALIAVLAIKANYALTNEIIRPKSIDDFSEKRFQTHFRIPAARVAWANYLRLRSDFPQLRHYTDDQIDLWIVESFAYLSELQLLLRGIRTSEYSPDLGQRKIFAHPDKYYRASVAPAGITSSLESSAGEANAGVVDLKGTGTSNQKEVENQVREFQRIQAAPASETKTDSLNKLRILGHRDGMMSLGEAIAEVSRQVAIQKAFDVHNAKYGTYFQTVESYFIIALDIDILKEGGRKVPSGIVGRQAHWRGSSGLETPRTIYTDDFGGKQGTVYESSVDFGGAIIRHPELQDSFGSILTDKDPDPQASNAWQYGHDTAFYVSQVVQHDYKEARRAVDAHISTMLAPIEPQYRTIPRPNSYREYIRYLVSRFTIQNQRSRKIIVEKFLSLDIADIFSNLESVFRLNLPISVVGPILQTLLNDGRIKPGSPEYKKLHKMGLDYRYAVEGSAAVTGPALDALASYYDIRSLTHITRALRHPDEGIRAKAVSLFLKRDIGQIVPGLGRVFEIVDYPISVIGPIVSRLLTDGRLQQGSDEYESVLNRSLEFKSQAAVIIPAIDILRQRNDPQLLNILENIFVLTKSEDVKSYIVEAVLDRETPEALSFSKTIFSKGSVSNIARYSDALLNKGRISPGVPGYSELLTATFESSERGSGSSQARFIYLEAVEGIKTAETLENIRQTLKQNWNEKIKAKAVEILFKREIHTILSFLDQMFEQRTDYFGGTDFYLNALVRDARLSPADLNHVVERAFSLPPDGTSARAIYPVFVWLRESGRPVPMKYILRSMADSGNDLRKAAVAEYLKSDIAQIWSHLDQVLQLDFPKTVRGAVLSALFADKRIPLHDSRHYEILEKARRFSNRMSDSVLNPLIEAVSDDPDPRSLSFIVFCLTHSDSEVRKVAVKAFLKRSLPEMISHLDSIFQSEKPHTVIAPVVRGLLDGSRLAKQSEDYYNLVDRALSYISEDPEEVIQEGLNAMQGDSSVQGNEHLLSALRYKAARKR